MGSLILGLKVTMPCQATTTGQWFCWFFLLLFPFFLFFAPNAHFFFPWSRNLTDETLNTYELPAPHRTASHRPFLVCGVCSVQCRERVGFVVCLYGYTLTVAANQTKPNRTEPSKPSKQAKVLSIHATSGPRIAYTRAMATAGLPGSGQDRISVSNQAKSASSDTGTTTNTSHDNHDNHPPLLDRRDDDDDDDDDDDAAFTLNPDYAYQPRKLKVFTIGAGFSGLLMAHKFQHRFPDLQDVVDHTIFEARSEVGGTWSANDYPGVQCDVPAHIYVRF